MATGAMNDREAILIKVMVRVLRRALGPGLLTKHQSSSHLSFGETGRVKKLATEDILNI